MSYLWNMILCICLVLPVVEAIARKPPNEPLLGCLAAIATGTLFGAIGGFVLYKVRTRLWQSGATLEGKPSFRSKATAVSMFICAAGWIIAVGLTSSYAADFVYRWNAK